MGESLLQKEILTLYEEHFLFGQSICSLVLKLVFQNPIHVYKCTVSVAPYLVDNPHCELKKLTSSKANKELSTSMILDYQEHLEEVEISDCVLTVSCISPTNYSNGICSKVFPVSISYPVALSINATTRKMIDYPLIFSTFFCRLLHCLN